MSADRSSAASAPVVYVIDDDASVRAALEDLLASVGLASMLFGSVRAFVDALRPNVPSCLVLDVRMPGQSGIEFHRDMAGRGIYVPVVFITGHGDIAMSVRAMKAGAIEFLTKPFDNQDLLDAIHRGIECDRARRSTDEIISELRHRYKGLADGEKAVMALVVQGLLNKQIAGELGVSEITVKVRRSQAMQKMGARSLPDLVRMSDALSGGQSKWCLIQLADRSAYPRVAARQRLPPNSPDFNPIEQVVAKMKALLRHAAPRSVDAILTALKHIRELPPHRMREPPPPLRLRASVIKSDARIGLISAADLPQRNKSVQYGSIARPRIDPV